MDDVAQRTYGQFIPKDNGLIPFLALYVGYINQTHVHADVTHIGCLFSVHQTVAIAIPQQTVQSVGITDGQCGNPAVA